MPIDAFLPKSDRVGQGGKVRRLLEPTLLMGVWVETSGVGYSSSDHVPWLNATVKASLTLAVYHRCCTPVLCGCATSACCAASNCSGVVARQLCEMGGSVCSSSVRSFHSSSSGR